MGCTTHLGCEANLLLHDGCWPAAVVSDTTVARSHAGHGVRDRLAVEARRREDGDFYAQKGMPAVEGHRSSQSPLSCVSMQVTNTSP
jgi:hypothetical protein